jgi:hypothetical protein
MKFFDRTRKRWPFNRGDGMGRFDCTCIMQFIFLYIFFFSKNSCDLYISADNAWQNTVIIMWLHYRITSEYLPLFLLRVKRNLTLSVFLRLWSERRESSSWSGDINFLLDFAAVCPSVESSWFGSFGIYLQVESGLNKDDSVMESLKNM